MFSNSAQYYDDIYASIDKNYAAEARKTHRFIRKHKASSGKRLLDVACGTGIHAGLLAKYYQVEGLDLDPEMLSVARKKHPEIPFQQGDMVDFVLRSQFDAIVCLFSSIGYVRTRTRLRKALRNMSAHLLPGGVLLVEPWFTPEQWHVGYVGLVSMDKPDLRIVRMSRGAKKRGVSILEFEYLIGTPKGITHLSETHELGLFEEQDYLEAFRLAGLQVIHDPEGLDGRGLYVGVKPH
ncbi:MAG: class I SAM-dependent DNA methyltransferase [Bacteroidota bacterium]